MSMNITALTVAEARRFTGHLTEMRVGHEMYASGTWKSGRDLVFFDRQHAPISQLSSKNESVTAQVDNEFLRIIPINGMIVFVCEG